MLRGYDQLVNIVLDETEEFLRGFVTSLSQSYVKEQKNHMIRATDPEDPYKILDEKRPLGLVVCR